jgi:hypothetical protein
MQELHSRPRGLDGWKALTCSTFVAFSIVSRSLPHGAGLSAVLLSDGNLCYQGVKLRDAEESSVEREPSKTGSAIPRIVGMGV